ncbi:pyrroloquinoline quinone precursor peptide PqqA [Massilia sp. 9096]|uniref:pyrroloquinoline quinone precursor peptide PqqA n=1 Tax=Massilia sp. 9096 TaxID=1500894 RepID=UPI0009DE09A0
MLCAASRQRTFAGLETSMIAGILSQCSTASPRARLAYRHYDANQRRSIMTWQTPQAIDVRLGFEITMYISNR